MRALTCPPRCLTPDVTRPPSGTVEVATRTAIKTEGEDSDSEDHRRFPRAATETEIETENETGGDEEDTDRREAMHAQGGVFAPSISVPL